MKRIGFALALSACIVISGSAEARQAPGAPGQKGIWTPADKHGFVTSATRTSRVWQTLREKTLTEVYWPDLGTPATRDLRFAITDGKTFTDLDSQATKSRVEPADGRALSYRQVGENARWQLTKTIVTDPQRNAVAVRTQLVSRTGTPLKLYAILDPALSNSPNDDRVRGPVAFDKHGAVALLHTGKNRRTVSGYKGRKSDPVRRLRKHHLGFLAARRKGNVVMAQRVPTDGTVVLGFGRTRTAAVAAAQATRAQGFDPTAAAFAGQWHAYLDALPAAPASVPLDLVGLYDRSLMVMHAGEDKAHPGAGVASPTMPWAWGRLTIDDPSAPYHLVWSRDLYQVATAQIAAGDIEAANRALDFLLDTQQKPDGSFPQNSEVNGKPHWTNLQLDEVAFPIVLAWQLNRTDAATYKKLKRAANVIVKKGPKTQQERWENQDGWSPATIAAEIAGLICAADIARANGDGAAATRFETAADLFQRTVEGWTATRTGPYSPNPYYLRVTKNGKPDTAHPYPIGDGGPKAADQRSVVDPSFLELVRLGVKRPDDPVILNTVGVVDDQLGVTTPNGTFWHRFSFDGYGETRTGAPWDLSKDNSFKTVGRLWPLFAGERGEYELAAGRPATDQLRA
ncbi:MAG: glucoamylase, partial [Solirubrobacteraceae bacterium]|nr:glucoamylase [Solirubrobacteraceae bacterium]